MKTITLSHYTLKDIEAAPWLETWENLTRFASRMATRLIPLGFKLRLRKVIMDEITQDNLMTANMVTIECAEAGTPETPIENLLMLELDFTPCPECRTPEGQEFPCRTFTSFGGEVCQALPEEFFMEATLRVAFKSQHEGGCQCGSCDSCASGCGDEERGIRSEEGR
ncbi:MAG: DUF2703 domain-containing protein [Synergistaceae bacterium]|nr:DUF2703 domain-containing protein [Synergistaceae bacterium]